MLRPLDQVSHVERDRKGIVILRRAVEGVYHRDVELLVEWYDDGPEEWVSESMLRLDEDEGC